MQNYQFTDTELAAQRLAYLANVFSESTKALVHEAVDWHPDLVLDLGCGPGYTTKLLAALTQCKRIVGLENSEHFVALAQETGTEQISFCQHDVTTTPFPEAPSDVIYCRFLLTHLGDPIPLLTKWATQLSAQSLLIVEETEWIETDCEVFTDYIEVVLAMLASQSNQLYVGPVLQKMDAPNMTNRRSSLVRELPVSAHQAAMMFWMNIRSWKHQPFIQQQYSETMIAELEKALEKMAKDTEANENIVWGLRQIVFQRG